MKYEYKRCNGAFRFSAVAAGGILTLALAACGGGSDTVTHEPTIGALTVAEAVGKYSTGCVMRAGPGSEYKEIIGTLTDSGGGVGKGVIQYKAYGQDASCSPASLNYDVTATVEVRPTAETKRFAAATVEHPYVGTANVAEVILSGLTLSRGSFSGKLPTFGASTKVGYLRDKTDLRFVAGSRQADGLGAYISNVVLKKLP